MPNNIITTNNWEHAASFIQDYASEGYSVTVSKNKYEWRLELQAPN